jgi:tetratricopeptide (TPR) repeat protein
MRLVIAAAALAACLATSTPAEARHGWYHWRWGGIGWGGWGGVGWCGPRFSVGFYPYCAYNYYQPFWCCPADCYPYSYGYPLMPYGAGVPVGFANTYRPWGVYANRSVNPDLLAEALRAVASNAGVSTTERPLRWSNPQWRRKAERFIAEGDELFRAQNYHSALQKYKLAATLAPDVAEAHWRQGHALIATSNFELAARAFKRAIAISQDIRRADFQLDDLYGAAGLAKTAHIESLAEWAMTQSDSPDPFFLLGVFLTYDGQPQRAEKFFAHAAQLSGIANGHLAAFLTPWNAVPAAERVAEDRELPVSIPTEI